MFVKRFFFSTSFKIKKCFSSGMHFSTSPTFKEQKIKIRNYEINYLTVGRGPHHVFCAASMFGTIWSDFRKQIVGFDRDKFSLVVWDTPDFGKSIALNNKDSFKIFSSDAENAYELMKALQIPKYSILGWSYGGLLSLLLSSRYPDVVNKVVAWGTSTFLFPHEIDYYKKISNLNTWPKTTKEAMIKLYGEENLIKKISKRIEELEAIYDAKITFCDEVKRVKCPTLLLYGAKDPVADSSHLKCLQGLIKNSRTHLYPEGKHNIHIQYADDFNKRVQEFLLQEN